MGRKIRRVKADAIHSEVQRTVDRQFFFLPTEEIRQLIGSSAGRAMKHYPVKLYWLDLNINHKQTGVAPISDSLKHRNNVVGFHRTMNSILAKEINRMLKRRGAVFASRNRSTEVRDDSSLEQQLLYAVTNMVKDGLTERVVDWGGVSSYNQLATGQVDVYSYINRTAWSDAGGKKCKKPIEAFTEQVPVVLTPLPGWQTLSPNKRQKRFIDLVAAEEAHFASMRQLENSSVVGPKKLSLLNPRSRPKNDPVFSRQPLCHCATAEGAEAFEKEWKTYTTEHRAASEQYRRGDYDVEFPSGSYKPPLFGVYA